MADESEDSRMLSVQYNTSKSLTCRPNTWNIFSACGHQVWFVLPNSILFRQLPIMCAGDHDVLRNSSSPFVKHLRELNRNLPNIIRSTLAAKSPVMFYALPSILLTQVQKIGEAEAVTLHLIIHRIDIFVCDLPAVLEVAVWEEIFCRDLKVRVSKELID
jgi:hypothetical protein